MDTVSAGSRGWEVRVHVLPLLAPGKVFFLVCEKIPVGSEKSGFRKYQKYRPKYR
jgi:hypothetical protein